MYSSHHPKPSYRMMCPRPLEPNGPFLDPFVPQRYRPSKRRVRVMLVWSSLLLGATIGLAQGFTSIDTFGSGDSGFSITFVDVGHPGNVGDPAGFPPGVGAVTYPYRMAKFECSEDMVNRANLIGKLGITLSTTGTNKPATMMTFYEVARFVNWLNTSSGHHAAYSFSERGEWLLWPADESWTLDGLNRYRHKDAFYFVPSADEWYKAAYFDGTNYYRYATGSNGTPTPVAQGTEPRTTVYAQPEEAGPADVDNAGGLSPYGTMAQGGNVYEWTESAQDGANDATDELLQVRGGRWATSATTLRGSSSNTGRPWQGITGTTGFRVASRVYNLPAAPRLELHPAPDGSGLELSFASQPSVVYDIERAPSPSGQYLTFQTLTGTGGVLKYVFKPADEHGAYYRVVATRLGL